MNRRTTQLCVLLGFTLLTACDLFHRHNENAQKFPDNHRKNRVLTKDMQDKLTPHEVVQRLKQGNQRFVSQKSVMRNHSTQIRKAVSGQYPKAIVLSCVDSRVPVEDVFDQGIGDIFVARVAGNFVNPDILGSMEYATAVVGVKVVLVMGHEHCGAVKAAIDNVDMGNITSLVNNIKPAIANLKEFPGDKSSKNPAYVHQVCKSNIETTMQNIRKDSKIMRELEVAGKIKIKGAVYDMDTGIVSFL